MNDSKNIEKMKATNNKHKRLNKLQLPNGF
jgi:hypothetical protein